MRYEKGHKEATRQRIIKTAAVRFRKDGIEAVGVADLMADAGLTHGGFYSHFKSKEDLVRSVVDDAASSSAEKFQHRVDEGGLEAWIRYYCSPAHRDHPEGGCIVAALGAELARHPGSTRKSFTKRMDALSEAIQKHLPSTMKSSEKRQTSITIFAVLSGAVQMARGVDDPALSDEILKAGVATALSLAQIKPGK